MTCKSKSLLDVRVNRKIVASIHIIIMQRVLHLKIKTIEDNFYSNVKHVINTVLLFLEIYRSIDKPSLMFYFSK